MPDAPFAWLLPDVLAGGPHPERNDRIALGRLHVTFDAVISVFDEPLPRRMLETWGPRYRFQKTREGAPPTDLAGACAFIDAARAAGVATLVHCYAGLGRTGTVLGAYLLHAGLCDDAEEAYARVRREYDPAAIETPAQRQALVTFALALRRRRR